MTTTNWRGEEVETTPTHTCFCIPPLACCGHRACVYCHQYGALYLAQDGNRRCRALTKADAKFANDAPAAERWGSLMMNATPENIARHGKRTYNHTNLHTLICEICGVEFQHSQPTKATCSKQCNRRRWNKRALGYNQERRAKQKEATNGA